MVPVCKGHDFLHRETQGINTNTPILSEFNGHYLEISSGPSRNEWLKQHMVYPYYGILFSNEEELAIDT